MVKLHYNWKYTFLRPSKYLVTERYNLKFRPNKTTGAGPSDLH